MSEQFKPLAKKVVKKTAEFATLAKDKIVESYIKDPKKTLTMIAAPLLGLGVTQAGMSLLYVERDIPPITCASEIDWQKNKVKAINPKTGEQILKNTEGNITPNELQKIIGNNIKLQSKKISDIPALTNIFSQVLNKVDQRRLLTGTEQIDLYSWFLDQYSTLVVIDGKIHPKNLEKFVERFNAKTEELRNVGFTELSKNNCIPESIPKLSKKNKERDFEITKETVENLLKYESQGRVNNLADPNKTKDENNKNKTKKTSEQRRKDEQNPNLNIPESRKPELTEVQKLARKLLLISNALSPERNLSQQRLNRILSLLIANNEKAKIHGSLKKSNDRQNDMKNIVTEVNATRNELIAENEKNNSNIRLSTGVIIALMCSLASYGYFADKNKKIKKQVNGPIENSDIFQEQVTKTKWAETIAELRRFITIINSKGEKTKIFTEGLIPGETKSSKYIRALIEKWYEIKPKTMLSIFLRLIQNNTEAFGLMTYSTHGQLISQSYELAELLNDDISNRPPKERVKKDIEELNLFLSSIVDYINNLLVAKINNSNEDFKRDQIIYKETFIPYLNEVLDNFNKDIEKLDNAVALEILKNNYLNEINIIFSNIPSSSGIEEKTADEYIISDAEISEINFLFLNIYNTDNPSNLTILSLWEKSLFEGFNLFEIAMKEFLRSSRLTKNDVMLSPLNLKKVEKKRDKLQDELNRFVENYRMYNINENQLLAYCNKFKQKPTIERLREKMANDELGAGPVLTQLFDLNIIQNIIERYYITTPKKELKGLEFTILLGGMTSISRIYNQSQNGNEQPVNGKRFIKTISEIGAELKCQAIDLNKVDREEFPEVEEYIFEALLPIMQVLSELNNYTLENISSIEEMVEIYDSIKLLSSNEDRKLYVEDYNNIADLLISNSNFVEINTRLLELIELEEQIYRNISVPENFWSENLSPEINKIMRLIRVQIEKLKIIFEPIEQTLR